jgi:uncharacterized small protein (DUF1192 family)
MSDKEDITRKLRKMMAMGATPEHGLIVVRWHYISTMEEWRMDVDLCADAADEIERLRAERDDIEDLRFQLQGTIGELENALSRERTLLNDQEDFRIGADNLHAEIERLGAERDKARREVCEILERDAGFTAQRQAEWRGWDCFKEVNG